MGAHTPGPWEPQESRFRDSGLMAVVRWEAGFPMQIASVLPAPLGAKEANARLIAAAPDLLESLAGALRSSNGQDCPYCGSRFGGPKECTECAWFGEARAAITKATGK